MIHGIAIFDYTITGVAIFDDKMTGVAIFDDRRTPTTQSLPDEGCMVLQHIGWPTGDDRIYEIEVLLPDGKAPTDPTKGVQDVTGFTMVWVLSTLPDLTDTPLIEKRTGGLGITVTGTYNPSARGEYAAGEPLRSPIPTPTPSRRGPTTTP